MANGEESGAQEGKASHFNVSKWSAVPRVSQKKNSEHIRSHSDIQAQDIQNLYKYMKTQKILNPKRERFFIFASM